MSENNFYAVPEEMLPALNEALEKLNKRARKLGVEEIILDVIGDELLPIEAPQSFYERISRKTKIIVGHRRVLHVRVDGEPPKLSGWSFQGVVDFSDPGVKGFMLRMNPLAGETPEGLREEIEKDPGRCDHCGTHRYRKETFLVKNDEGAYRLVGRSCLKDFLGHKNPEAIASYFEYFWAFLAEIGPDRIDRGTCGPRPLFVEPAVDFLAAVCFVAKQGGGFVTSKQAREERTNSTGNKAWDLMHPSNKYEAETYEEFLREKSDHVSKAQKLLDWAPALWETGRESDYVFNMKAALGSEVVTYKTHNLVASLFTVHARAVERKLQEKKAANSEWQGDVKDRLKKVPVTCTRTSWVEGHYGMTQVCKFVDESGNIYAWFNSGSQEAEQGTEYQLTGTVKKHSEFKGVKETQLTRCKL